ncbi:type II toxin-antitoxin system mRNA interferase toxin, RelE/StbE family [Crocosphaera sp. XPORK-15E]|uniref:type II toxin-antitoxin system RelE/ParE family toxin n=1 Tax=Crocosphaera sp. XPORK-15E TaxID=3110247 RepID=UPI002B1FDED1|nr:type II toxin-antitoxin system mRNA interferase toxin, RelE/StbE family [Crocosphaera sp. XPORK-15E]MEA5536221.1 type II toxin-antitoxin system mRNA interferase toxin, RelE/StbE family [Crocosphaera sp. XPORK-15E]
MPEISFSDSFKRAFKKRIQGNENLEKKFRVKLEQFRDNPFDITLKTHKLSGKLKDLWSFSLEYDQRVLFYFTDDGKVVFVDIGNHDQVY